MSTCDIRALFGKRKAAEQDGKVLILFYYQKKPPESLKSKIFPGEHAPRPRALSALFSKGDLCNPPFLEAGYGPVIVSTERK